MKATQGVLLLMIAALVLWLVWSNRSPFASVDKGNSTQGSRGESGIGSGSSGQGVGGGGGGSWSNPINDPNSSPESCMIHGGHWDYSQNKCIGAS